MAENNRTDQLQRYQDILSGTNIGTWEWNVQTGETVFNERWAEMIGYKLSELQPVSIESWMHFVHPDDGPQSEKLLNAHFAGETAYYVCEVRMQHKAGHWIWVLDQGKVVTHTADGKPEWMAGSHLEITALKEAESKLRISERAFRESFHNAAVGMAILDTHGNWKEVNKTLCDILGYTEEELKKLTFQELTHPDDLDKDLSLVHRILNNEIPFYHMEKRYFHKTGRVVHAILAVSLVRDEQEQPLHFISQVIDISQRVIAESERLDLLELTKDQNKRLQNFAYMVSHDLRTHSGNIRALLELMAEQKNTLKTDQHFQLIESASRKLEETVQKLSDVAKMNTTVAESLEDITLKSIIDSLLTSTLSLANEAEVEITIDVSPDCTVRAIPAYLESILLNLMTNAIKYASSERQSHLRISADMRDGFVVLKFADNGLGIDLNRHGDQLFKLNKTFHDHPDSRGIGLFITKNQIEAMGGKIEVVSKVDVGTTFFVFLINSEG